MTVMGVPICLNIKYLHNINVYYCDINMLNKDSWCDEASVLIYNFNLIVLERLYTAISPSSGNF